jgi:hypothetical protein
MLRASGTLALVKMRTACPGATRPCQAAPARDSTIASSQSPAAVAASTTA